MTRTLQQTVDRQSTSWRDKALCLQRDPESFFPTASEEAARPAKKTCRRCPVGLHCLAFVLELEGDAGTDRRHGVWAGLTPRQRTKFYRKLRGGDMLTLTLNSTYEAQRGEDRLWRLVNTKTGEVSAEAYERMSDVAIAADEVDVL